MSHSFTSRGARKVGGVKAKEQPRAPHFTCSPGLVRKGASSPPITLPRARSLAQPSLTHAGAVVGPQLEAWLALAAEGARQVHAAVLAVAVAALVYVWEGGQRAEAEVRWDSSWLGVKASPPIGLSVWAGLGQIRQDTHTPVLCHVW